jgi:putative flippase GtrA
MIPGRLRILLGDRQFLRFLVAGGVNTLFGFGVNIAVMLTGQPVWLSMLVGTVAGVVFNFRDLSARRLPRFVAGYAVVYLVGLAAFHVLNVVVPGPIVCQVLLVVPMALFSYLVMSRFVFQKHRDR